MNILICDDSGFARKQMMRCLPSDWEIDISYASNGKEGLDVIRAGKGEVVFLDLNMPEMDGYEVLEHIQSHDLPAMSIVVSGDVQEEAYKRVKKLGALDFIQKPVSADEIIRILKEYGLHEPHGYETTDSSDSQSQASEKAHLNAGDNTGDNAAITIGDSATAIDESYQEMANVALGRAVKLLAQYLGTFVEMSIPHANHMDLSELQMALQHVSINDKVSAVSQGFVGGGITGEAFLMFNESNIQNIATLLKFEGEITKHTQLELLMDIANILIGACLSGISDQLDLRLSQGHPQIFNEHSSVADVLKDRGAKPALTLEMGCSIEGHDIDIELLLMFTDESIPMLDSKLNYMVS